MAGSSATTACRRTLRPTAAPEGLPRLVRMARQFTRQYHNEPATSAGAERLFSAASRAHHDLKGAMNDS